MSLEGAVASRNALLTTVGKGVLNAKYPSEFELYVIALELTDVDFNTLRYFIFPVNPSSLEEAQPKLTNIKKTLSGITVLDTTTFITTDISLSGNFGRKFKVLLGSTYEDFITSFKTTVYNGEDRPVTKVTKEGIGNGLKDIFDNRVKTGYGCTKILEEIINESRTLDEYKRPKRLLFHNAAFGNSYLVKAMNVSFQQNENTNMIWNYNLQLKAIATLDSINQQKIESTQRELTIGSYIQKKVNDTLNLAGSLLEKGVNAITSKVQK